MRNRTTRRLKDKSIKIWSKRKRGFIGRLPRKNPLELENVSLQDMIAASRIVSAREEGLTFNPDAFVSAEALKLANRIDLEHPQLQNATVRIKRIPSCRQPGISYQELNHAIVKRNRKENKPTERTKELYKQLISED